jgi:hypothetical protein
LEQKQELRELLDLERAEEVLEQRQELRELLDLKESRGSAGAWLGTQGTSRSRREQRKCFLLLAGTQELPDLEERRESAAHGQDLRELLDLEEKRESAAHG